MRSRVGRWAKAALLGLAATAAGGASADAPPALPGPAPRPRAAGFDAAAQNAACVRCHADEGRQWQGSLHRRSFADPVFAAAYAIEPLPFCRGCHAPEAGAAAADVGVGCVTCHLEGDVIVSARAPTRPAPHAVVVDPRLATAEACRACHQFDFFERPGTTMQRTLHEHAASGHRGEGCNGCHMPNVGGHRGHDFAVAGRADVLGRALTVDATRFGTAAARLTLRADDVGHAVPTGDMFRRLEVRGAAVDGAGRVVARATPVVLAREFEFDQRARTGSPGDAFRPTDRVEVRDGRVPATGEPRAALLRFDRGVAGLELRWEVAYQRMDPVMAQLAGLDPAADEVIVARGALAKER